MNLYFFIFKRPNDSYYFKLKGPNYYLTHSTGWTNQYGHEIVLVISIPKAIIKRTNPFFYVKHKLNRSIIKVLEFIIHKLD